MVDEVVLATLSSVHLCCTIAPGEDRLTGSSSMSLEAFELSPRTILREVHSQYPLSSAVNGPDPGRPLLRRPPSVFGISMPGSISLSSRRELKSLLEGELTVGKLSSMPEPECACRVGVGLAASPLR